MAYSNVGKIVADVLLEKGDKDKSAVEYLSEVTEDLKGKKKYPIYDIVENPNPEGDFNYGQFSFQDYIGTPIMPTLQWVNYIKTGEIEYDPEDSEQQKRIDDYKKYVEANGQPSGLPTPEEIIANEVGPVVGQLAESVGSSWMQGAGLKGGLPFTTSVMDATKDQTLFSDLTSAKAAKAANQSKQFLDLQRAGMKDGVIETSAIPEGTDVAALGGQTGINVMEDATFGELLNPTTAAGAQNWKGAAGGAVGNFAVQLVMGRDPVKAAKSAGAGAIGKALGTAIGGPIGGWIGGALGSIIGGRVICNELMRQGLLTRKQVVMDYRFTRDYLTPTHVNGYHIWAVWMVKQMRQGKFVNFWKHVAGHRANEIAYIYGEREKPDYLGKIYRKILEPTCWLIGSVCKKTDWSVLYNQKEI